jgi:hypothetical protein
MWLGPPEYGAAILSIALCSLLFDYFIVIERRLTDFQFNILYGMVSFQTFFEMIGKNIKNSNLVSNASSIQQLLQ